MSEVLRLSDVSLARGGMQVLDGVSFALLSGRALVLRGPNGIGKSTLLRAVAGLQPVLAGQIKLDRETLAYIGHSDGIKSTLTVAENLNFWAQAFGKNGICQALEAFDLAPLAARPAGTLSAGQKRRLGLARLLVTGRALWLLDEPTVSLDTASVAMFAAVVRAHLAAGGAALMATHIDLGLADADLLDLARYRSVSSAGDAFDEAFS